MLEFIEWFDRHFDDDSGSRLAPVEVAIRWEHPAWPPFVLQVFPASAEPTFRGQIRTMTEAIDAFVEHALPQRAGWYAWITDANHIVQIGYDTSDPTAPEGKWIGVAAGFAELERNPHVDVVDVAVWESIARTAIGR